MLFDVIASVALGVPGSYSFYGIPVNFIDNGASPISKLAYGVIGGNYINAFVHELGHSLAFKHVCGVFGEIFINSDSGGYCTIRRWHLIGATNFENSFVSLSGPLLQISFGLLTSWMTHKIYTWSFKYKDKNRVFYWLFITTLKVQNIFTVLHPMFAPHTLFLKLLKSSKHMSDDSDFMKIYRSSGALGASLSSALILSIGFLAFKIIFLQPGVTEKPLPLTFYERIVSQLRNLISQVNLVAMGIMKSAIQGNYYA